MQRERTAQDSPGDGERVVPAAVAGVAGRLPEHALARLAAGGSAVSMRGVGRLLARETSLEEYIAIMGASRTAIPAAKPATKLTRIRELMMSHLAKWEGAVEGNADGRFKQLFGDLTKTRQDHAKEGKSYTTCIGFQKTMLSTIAVELEKEGAKLHAKLLPQQMKSGERKRVVPSGYAIYEKLPEAWTEGSPGMSGRPRAGDIYVLNVATGEGATLTITGEGSHVGFIKSIAVDSSETDGVKMETWTTIDGGQGYSTKYNKDGTVKETGAGEAVLAVARRYNPKTGEITGEKQQVDKYGKVKRTMVKGWVDLDKLVL